MFPEKLVGIYVFCDLPAVSLVIKGHGCFDLNLVLGVDLQMACQCSVLRVSYLGHLNKFKHAIIGVCFCFCFFSVLNLMLHSSLLNQACNLMVVQKELDADKWYRLICYFLWETEKRCQASYGFLCQ